MKSLMDTRKSVTAGITSSRCLEQNSFSAQNLLTSRPDYFWRRFFGPLLPPCAFLDVCGRFLPLLLPTIYFVNRPTRVTVADIQDIRRVTLWSLNKARPEAGDPSLLLTMFEVTRIRETEDLC